MPNEELAYLLELRIKVRGNPEALALVDRCLALVARAESADAEALRGLAEEVRAISDALALRYGAPRTAVLQ